MANGTMGLGEWSHVANSIGAIGATIDRKRQQQKQEARVSEEDLIKKQSEDAFNYFIDHFDEIDYDNPKKQAVSSTALHEVAGVPAQRPKIPIENLDPRAIGNGRRAAMIYITNKQTLSEKSIQATEAKAEQDYKKFMSGMSHAAALMGSGNEEAAKAELVKTYNKYYPDTLTLKIAEDGRFVMASPTGKETDLGVQSTERVINELLSSPMMSKENMAKAAQMTQRGTRAANEEMLLHPKKLYDAQGNEYNGYAFIDRETNQPMHEIWSGELGTPGSRRLMDEEIKSLNLKSSDALKVKQGVETNKANIEKSDAQTEYYKGGGRQGKRSAEKESPPMKLFVDTLKSLVGKPENRTASQEELSEKAANIVRTAYPDFVTPLQEKKFQEYQNYNNRGPGGAVGEAGKVNSNSDPFGIRR